MVEVVHRYSGKQPTSYECSVYYGEERRTLINLEHMLSRSQLRELYSIHGLPTLFEHRNLYMVEHLFKTNILPWENQM